MHTIDKTTRQALQRIGREALALLNDVHECIDASTRSQGTLVLGVVDKANRIAEEARVLDETLRAKRRREISG